MNGGITCGSCTGYETIVEGRDVFLPLVGEFDLNVWGLPIDISVEHICADLFALPNDYFEDSATDDELICILEFRFGRDVAEIIFMLCTFDGGFNLCDVLGYYEM